MNEQKKLFRMIQDYSFAVYEAVLYLDGHPCDHQALAFFNRNSARLKELTSKYEKKFGPLTVRGNDSEEEWKWTASPWPWEYESV